ncbi:hypothetical protein [Bifidobacterium pullorum]|uniref:hypothetical protein n=1 Tax=Bifidobacterium pullorum TaxID=78448 RepID=UPI001376AE2E|nr:hypothetical protein [Bifidobacterium pullorum]
MGGMFLACAAVEVVAVRTGDARQNQWVVNGRQKVCHTGLWWFCTPPPQPEDGVDPLA